MQSDLHVFSQAMSCFYPFRYIHWQHYVITAHRVHVAKKSLCQPDSFALEYTSQNDKAAENPIIDLDPWNILRTMLRSRLQRVGQKHDIYASYTLMSASKLFVLAVTGCLV